MNSLANYNSASAAIAVPTENARPPVEEALEATDRCIGYTSELLDMLEKRLDVALTPRPPSPPANLIAGVLPPSSLLVGRLQSQTAIAAQNNARLMALLDRIEL